MRKCCCGNGNGPNGGVVEVYFPVDMNGNQGQYRTRGVSSTGNFNFTFVAPFDAVTILEIAAYAISDLAAANPAASLDLVSMYGAVGEQYNNHTESDLGALFAIPMRFELIEFDLSSVFTSLAAGDRAGINIKHNAISSGTIDYLGIRLKYSQV